MQIVALLLSGIVVNKLYCSKKLLNYGMHQPMNEHDIKEEYFHPGRSEICPRLGQSDVIKLRLIRLATCMFLF